MANSTITPRQLGLLADMLKPQLGMGNHSCASHEFLLLGVRGSLPFADKICQVCQSWLLFRRTRHSRKPYAVRELIKRVSPGPYLELYRCLGCIGDVAGTATCCPFSHGKSEA